MIKWFYSLFEIVFIFSCLECLKVVGRIFWNFFIFPFHLIYPKIQFPLQSILGFFLDFWGKIEEGKVSKSFRKVANMSLKLFNINILRPFAYKISPHSSRNTLNSFKQAFSNSINWKFDFYQVYVIEKVDFVVRRKSA